MIQNISYDISIVVSRPKEQVRSVLSVGKQVTKQARLAVRQAAFVLTAGIAHGDTRRN